METVTLDEVEQLLQSKLHPGIPGGMDDQIPLNELIEALQHTRELSLLARALAQE
jgi:hypothetical protein